MGNQMISAIWNNKNKCKFFSKTNKIAQACRGSAIDHFTVACLVARPLNESEAGGGLALIETSLLLLC